MAAQDAGEVLGVDQLRFGEWPDNRLDSVALLELPQRVEEVVREIRPETIFTHHPHHQNVGVAASKQLSATLSDLANPRVSPQHAPSRRSRRSPVGVVRESASK